MAPPSKLSIASSSVQRLLREETSYHKELEQQEARIRRLEGTAGDENSGYLLKQERQAIVETKSVFGPLRLRIGEAAQVLSAQIGEEDGVSTGNTAEVEKARAILRQAEDLLNGNAG